MLAFIRSEYTFGGPGQIYVKHVPDGEPVQLTHDNLNKRGSPQFSPDGTRIAYAALKPGSGWDTWVVPVFGGRPHLFLANASGLTWIEAEASRYFSQKVLAGAVFHGITSLFRTSSNQWRRHSRYDRV